jgi:hypothetical protein
MMYFALRREFGASGFALGLGFLTKGTAYLFGPPLLLATLLPARAARGLLTALPCALLLNVPHYARNYELSGSPLGFRTAVGNDGPPGFRWTVDRVGPSAAISNFLRVSAEHLGGRGERWNRGVYDAVVRAHEVLGLDVNDRATTWLGASFEPPRNSNHEADAHNRWQMIGLLVVPFAMLRDRRRDRLYLYFGLALGYLLFCSLLRWQPFLMRMQLPLFVAGSALLGALAEKLPGLAQALLCLLLLDAARLPLIENWVRPLRGSRSLMVTSREDNYFADMTRFGKRDEYLAAVRRTVSSGCTRIGIDNSMFHLEYPFQALVLEKQPRALFIHAGVDNPSARFPAIPLFQPCAVFCPDCAAQPGKTILHRAAGDPVVFGRSVLYTRRRRVNTR